MPSAGVRAALCADQDLFLLHPPGMQKSFLLEPVRVQICLGAAHSLPVSSRNTLGRAEAVKRVQAAALRLSFH